MTRKATLWVTNDGLMSRAIGMNHAGLELIDGSSYTYVTWDGGGPNIRSGGAVTPSPNLDPDLVRESSCPNWGWKGFSDEEATQCRADRGLASAG